jgi:hypothetical protein
MKAMRYALAALFFYAALWGRPMSACCPACIPVRRRAWRDGSGEGGPIPRASPLPADHPLIVPARLQASSSRASSPAS